MDRAQRMDDMGSRDVARASVMLAMTRTREEERRFKEEYAAEGIRTAAVDFGGEFLPSVSRIVERAVIAAKREGVIADTSHEEGVVAGATHEAIMQISAKAMGLMSQVPHPFRFRYGFALPMSGLSPNDNPLNSGKIYHAHIIKHRFKSHMIVSAMDMFPQSPDTAFLFTGGNGYAKPGIF